MDYSKSPFHKFMGWKTLALLVVTMAYSIWFTGPGPYGQYAALFPGKPLEELGFYSGQYAVSTLSALDEDGRATALTALIFDVPYMILLALSCEALIAFGLRRLPLKGPVWPMLFVLPIAFLLSDFAEDSALALTLVTESEIIGSIAGFMTGMKFFTVMAAMLTGFVLSVSGLIYWGVKSLKS